MMAAKRILYILNSAGGGATQGIIDLLQGISHEKFEAFVVFPHHPNDDQEAVFSDLARKTFVVPMIWWNKKTTVPLLWRMLTWIVAILQTWGRLKPTLSLYKLIRLHNIDLVYTNTSMILEGAVAAWLCRVPHIWHIKEGIGQQGRVKFWLPDWLLVKFITKLSNRTLVMTRFIGKIFVRHNLGHKTIQIYDGVYLNNYAGNLRGEELRKKIGITGDQILIGMVASPSSTWKEHIVFIDMAAHLVAMHTNLAFVIFGAQPREMKNLAYNHPWNYFLALQNRISELKLEENIVWAGLHPNIPQMMAALDFLVHPCRIEPFGRIAIEAMAARRPVIGTSSGGIAESVIDGYTGYLISPGDTLAFVKAASNLIHDDILRKTIGNNGHKHVAENFTVQEHIEVISTLFTNIINHPQ